MAAGIEIVFVVLESGDEKVNGTSKSVPETAAVTTPLPFAFIKPLTVPAPPTLLPITVPLHVPEVIVPTLVKLDPVIVLANEVPVNVPALAIILAELAAVNLPFESTVNVGIAVEEP